MSKLGLRYFSEKDNFMNKLDCLEIIKYVSIADYFLDFNYVFCDDINLKVVTGKDVPFIEKNFFYYNDKMFKIKRTNCDPHDAYALIRTSLDEGKTIAIHTARNLLPMYIQSDMVTERIIDGHYTPIVGYNDDDFYFVDTIDMLKPEVIVRHENENIYIFKKEELALAFDALCEIIIVEVDLNYLITITDFKNIINTIIENYHKKSNKFSHELYGRESLVYIIDMLSSSSYELLKKHMEQDFFFLHLMMTSRVILKYCIIGYEQKTYLKHQENKVKTILINLDKSIEVWSNIKNLILMHTLKPNINLKEELSYLLREALSNEDDLFDSLILLTLKVN